MNKQKCAECGITVDSDYEIDPEWVCPFCEEKEEMSTTEIMRQATKESEGIIRHDLNERERINASAGKAGELIKSALGIDWYACESAARRVAEYVIAQATTSDPLRQFEEEKKEKEVAKLLDRIGNSKSYTIAEYREIEMLVRKLASLPLRDYRQQVFEDVMHKFKEEGPNRGVPGQDAAPGLHREVNPTGLRSK